MALTVTAAQSGSNPFNGILLSVRVLTGAKAAASQTGATAHAANTTVSLTTTTAGSVPYGGSADSAGTAYTGLLASTTQLFQDNDATNGATYATWKAAAATGTPGATNFGWSTPGATDIGVAAEILASGTIAEDGSTPAAAHTESATTITTASFSPPSGSLLVAVVATDTGGVPESVTISDSASLTWHQLIFQNGAAFMGAGVWVADAPAGGTTVNLTTPNLALAAPLVTPQASPNVTLTTPNLALAAPLLTPQASPVISLTTPNLALAAPLVTPSASGNQTVNLTTPNLALAAPLPTIIDPVTGGTGAYAMGFFPFAPPAIEWST